MERLSGLDASFLYLETPRMHLHVALCGILDTSGMSGGYDFDRLRRRIASKTHLLPPFRRKLVEVPLGLHHPVWIEDPDFDAVHHVRRAVCPSPGGLDELGALCGRICSTPLDRSRPLWEIWIIEGLAEDRCALLAKVHHAAVDGQGGAGFLVHLFGLAPDSSEPPDPEAPGFEADPSGWAMVREAVGERMRQPKELVDLVFRTARHLREVARSRHDREHVCGATPFTAPRTRFNAALTPTRNAAFTRVPLANIKAVKNAFGCTVNDVVLAITAGALRRYLAGIGELPPKPLIAACPISVDPAGSKAPGANHVSAMFTSLATDFDDPVERLAAIRETTLGAKEEHDAIGADMVQTWAEFAAQAALHLGSRFYAAWKLANRHRPILNVIVSNVPGPPFPIFLGDARVTAVYPMGPVMEGAGLNVTVMSYCGAVGFGITAAADLVPDVRDLANAIRPSLEELLAAARTKGLGATEVSVE